jgi:hypothetical protein
MSTSVKTVAKTRAIELRTRENLVELRVRGRLSREDYDTIVPLLVELANEHGLLRFLIFLDDFHGLELDAFWAELKFDVKNRKNFGRIAVVGATKLQRAAIEAAAVFFPDSVEFFSREETAKAREWIARVPDAVR